MAWSRALRPSVPPERHRQQVPWPAVLVLAVVILALAGHVAEETVAAPGPPSNGGAASRRVTAATHEQASTTSTTELDRGFPPLLPTAATPLRVLEIGDSLGIDLGDQLRSQLDSSAMASTTVASLGDTGLSNVAYYDWPVHLATLVTTGHPQVVVVFMGANDDQGFMVDGAAAAPGSAAWLAGYSQRVADVLRVTTDAGVRLVWVGMPPMANTDLDTAVQTENAIYRTETATFPGTLYVSSDSVLGRGSGLFESSAVDASGRAVVLRTPDGVHLTPAGAALLARTVIDAIDTRWHLTLDAPATPGSVTTGSAPTAKDTRSVHAAVA